MLIFQRKYWLFCGVLVFLSLSAVGLCGIQPTSIGGQEQRPTVEDSGPKFGLEAESRRLRAEKTAIEKENDRLDKVGRLLKSKANKLISDYKAAGIETAMLSRRIANFRCPFGYTLGGCLARPPVCTEAILFQREMINEIERQKAISRRLGVENKRLQEMNRSFRSQVELFNQRAAQWRGDVEDFNRRVKSHNTNGSPDSFGDIEKKARENNK